MLRVGVVGADLVVVVLFGVTVLVVLLRDGVDCIPVLLVEEGLLLFTALLREL